MKNQFLFVAIVIASLVSVSTKSFAQNPNENGKAYSWSGSRALNIGNIPKSVFANIILILYLN